MSLLFDALKRAQGDGEKKLQMPDASSHLITGEGSQPNEPGKPPAKPKQHVMAYAIAGLALFAGGLAWFLYHRHVPVSTQLVALPASAVPAATQAAASSVAQADVLAALPPTGSGGAVGKAWTHPRTTEKPHKHQRKLPKYIIPPGPDPLKQAYATLSRGDLDLAEQQYLAVLAHRPHEKDALLGLAVIAQRKQQSDRAADLYRQVLHEDMGNASAAAGLVSLSAVADPVAAESQLRELIDIKPDAAELHYALGSVLARQQQWSDAQQSFYRAYTLAPDNALYAYNLAVSLDHLHQPVALGYYKAVLEKSGSPAIDRSAIKRRIDELSGTANLR